MTDAAGGSLAALFLLCAAWIWYSRAEAEAAAREQSDRAAYEKALLEEARALMAAPGGIKPSDRERIERALGFTIGAGICAYYSLGVLSPACGAVGAGIAPTVSHLGETAGKKVADVAVDAYHGVVGLF